MIRFRLRTETIEQLFENYKASYNEETPQSAEQQTAMNELEKEIFQNLDTNLTSAFDKAVELSRASEKAGFILGFRMAMNLKEECRA